MDVSGISELDQKKLDLEREKLKKETDTARFTAGAVLLTAIISVVTFIAGNIQHRNSIEAELQRQSIELQAERETQQRQAEADFALAALGIAMDARDPAETSNKLEVIVELFEEWLPGDKLGDLDGKFRERQVAVSKKRADQQAKKDLMLLLIENPEQRREILYMWSLFFPGEKWLLDIPKESVINRAKGTDEASKRELILLLIENPEQREDIIHVWSLFFPDEEWLGNISRESLKPQRQ